MSGTPAVFPVALTACADYAPGAVSAAVAAVLDASGWKPGFGDKVLVKPNLLRAVPLACTHPQVVAAACVWLLERGTRVTVADSPGFGTAGGVAEAVGLNAALRPLGLAVRPLDNAVPVPLGDGLGQWGVSRMALESDAVLSVPRVKAHAMLRLSLSVKNLFGCVCGLRKAWAHTAQGSRPGGLESGMLALHAALPPVVALADGVVAMHRTGPAKGSPYPLGLLAASACPQALDTAIGALLGAKPASVPLWAEALRRALPGADVQTIAYPLELPEKFDASLFILPAKLEDISFRPHRLLLSLGRRLVRAWRGR